MGETVQQNQSCGFRRHTPFQSAGADNLSVRRGAFSLLHTRGRFSSSLPSIVHFLLR